MLRLASTRPSDREMGSGSMERCHWRARSRPGRDRHAESSRDRRRITSQRGVGDVTGIGQTAARRTGDPRYSKRLSRAYRQLLEQARTDKDRAERALAESSAIFREDQSKKPHSPSRRYSCPASWQRARGLRPVSGRNRRRGLLRLRPSRWWRSASGRSDRRRGENRCARSSNGGNRSVRRRWPREEIPDAVKPGTDASRRTRQVKWDPLLMHLSNSNACLRRP